MNQGQIAKYVLFHQDTTTAGLDQGSWWLGVLGPSKRFEDYEN